MYLPYTLKSLCDHCHRLLYQLITNKKRIPTTLLLIEKTLTLQRVNVKLILIHDKNNFTCLSHQTIDTD